MSTTISASDPRITHYPSSAWFSNSDNTSILTFTAGATTELSFSGEFVQVFGEIPPLSAGRPAVSTYRLDNSTPVVFNDANFSNEGPVLSYYQSPRLEEGVHSLLITAVEDQTEFVLNSIVYGSTLSSFTASSMIGAPSSPSTSFSPIANVRSSTFKLPVGGIVGGIIAALVLPVVAALIIFCRRRRRKISSLRTQSDTDYPPTPDPFLPGSRFETRKGASISLTRDSREGSIVSVQFPSGLNADSDPSSNSVVWGSIPYSISTTSTVVGDRSETSYMDKKDGQMLDDSSPTPVTTTALNYRTTVVSTGSRSTWNTRDSAPPPSWSGLSDVPPSYTTK